MKNSSLVFMSATLALLAAGCSYQTIEIRNGELPAAYALYAAPYLGTYGASDNSLFSDEKGLVTIALDGNRIAVKSTMDVVGEGCDSSIGELRELFVENDDNNVPSIDSATFELNPGKCRGIEGRTVKFVRNDRSFTMEFVTRTIHGGRGSVEQQHKTWVLRTK